MLINDEKNRFFYIALNGFVLLIVSFKILIRVVLSLFKHRTTPQWDG
jgi:hypothetical protein